MLCCKEEGEDDGASGAGSDYYDVNESDLIDDSELQAIAESSYGESIAFRSKLH